MTLPYLPSLAIRSGAAPVLRSTALFRWQATRGLTAVTGQSATLTRPSTVVSLVDSNAQLYNAVHSMPSWEARDWAGTGSRQTVGLRLGAADCAWSVEAAPQTSTLLVEFSENGTRTTAGAGLVYIGNDAQTGARLLIDSDGTNYRGTIHNGTTSQSITLSTATPTTGQSTRLALQLEVGETTMRVRLWLDVLRTPGDTLTAWSSTIARAGTWGSTTRCRINRVGSAGTNGNTWVRQVAWVAGLLSPQEIVERL